MVEVPTIGHPASLHACSLPVMPTLSALTEIAWRARRKTARGGISNLILYCGAAGCTKCGNYSGGRSHHCILPWGSLLRAVAAPELVSLRHIADLCLPDADVEIVLSYDEQRDAREGTWLPAGGLDKEHIATLRRLYEQAGLPIVAAERFSQGELADYQTTWAKRLAFGRPRKVCLLRARYAGPLK
jgi:16S rRNA (adenine(1408)-N(1))-methyltransferase